MTETKLEADRRAAKEKNMTLQEYETWVHERSLALQGKQILQQREHETKCLAALQKMEQEGTLSIHYKKPNTVETDLGCRFVGISETDYDPRGSGTTHYKVKCMTCDHEFGVSSTTTWEAAVKRGQLDSACQRPDVTQNRELENLKKQKADIENKIEQLESGTCTIADN